MGNDDYIRHQQGLIDEFAVALAAQQKRITALHAALDEAMGALAEVAFADDLDEAGRRNKARSHYEAIRATGLREEDRP